MHKDASPLKRLGLQPEDVLSALNSFDTVVDISEQDLERLYHQAQLNAYQRKSGEIRCSDIMSTDLITVTPDTPLFLAWQLLRKHKIGSLPVIDNTQQLQGIISTVDILKHLQVPSYAGLLKQLNGLFLQRHCIEKLGVEHIQDDVIAVQSAEFARVPKTPKVLSGRDAEVGMNLVEALEEHDDVQKVSTNLA